MNRRNRDMECVDLRFGRQRNIFNQIPPASPPTSSVIASSETGLHSFDALRHPRPRRRPPEKRTRKLPVQSRHYGSPTIPASIFDSQWQQNPGYLSRQDNSRLTFRYISLVSSCPRIHPAAPRAETSTLYFYLICTLPS